MGDKIPLLAASFMIICTHICSNNSLEYILFSASVLVCIQHYKLQNVLCVGIFRLAPF